MTADRTLMAMLRAVAGVIVVGAATLRATRNHQWTPQALARGRAEDLAQLRRVSGQPPEPAPLLVVSGSGEVPADADAVARPETPLHVLTGDGGAHVEVEAIMEAAHAIAGGGPVLCEGGAHLFGSLLDAAVPVDLFLTVAPQLAGRSPASTQRRSLVEGVALPPFGRRGTLRSVRAAESHLLLRYAVDAG